MKQLMKLLVAGFVCGMGFVGCGLSPTDEDSVSIDITAIGDIQGGSDKTIDGTIEGNPDPIATDITTKILDSAGVEVASTKIKVTKNTPNAKAKFDLTDDLAMKIVTTSEACNGSYTLKITAKAGTAETSKDASFKIVNGKNCTGTAITTIELEAGANGNSTLGSSIDLDGTGSVWKMAEAASNVSKIDICYAHSGVANNDKVGSAKWAKTGGYTFATAWDNPPDMKMHSVTMTGAQYTAVTTKEEIAALWVAASGVDNIAVIEGSVFIVKTTENAYALVRVASQTAGETGKITIKVAK